MRVFLVEDDAELRDTLQLALRNAGYGVDAVGDGEVADAVLSTGKYDLVVLDLGLPRMHGIELLRRLRGRGDWTPVLILTAREGVDNRVMGLDSGADDYLTKPFELRELEARVRALMRRAAGSKNILVNGPLCFDTINRQVTHSGNVLNFSIRELAILEGLMQRTGHVVLKKRLVHQLGDWQGEIGSNAIEVYIHRLRKKLSPCGVQIHTVHGLGYLLESLNEN
jgi:two-component system OmpR family response regulator